MQNRERILDAVDKVALETVREALLQHRQTKKHISHGTVRMPSQRPQRKAGRLDARFSSLSIPSVVIEEQEGDMCGDIDTDLSQQTGTICDTVSTPRRKLRKLEYIRNIVGCQNLPQLGCGDSGGTLKDMVSQSDRSQCQDNNVAVTRGVSMGETDSSRNRVSMGETETISSRSGVSMSETDSSRSKVSMGETDTSRNRVSMSETDSSRNRVSMGETDSSRSRVSMGETDSSRSRVSMSEIDSSRSRVSMGETDTSRNRVSMSETDSSRSRVSMSETDSSRNRVSMGETDSSRSRVSMSETDSSRSRVSMGETDSSRNRVSMGETDSSRNRVSMGETDSSRNRVSMGETDSSRNRVSMGETDSSRSRVSMGETDSSRNRVSMGETECSRNRVSMGETDSSRSMGETDSSRNRVYMDETDSSRSRVSMGETDSSRSGDRSREEKITTTEDRGNLLGPDQRKGNLSRCETSGQLGNRKGAVTVSQTESIAESAHMIGVIPVAQDIGRMGGNASKESIDAVLPSGMIVSDAGTADNCHNLNNEILLDSSSKVAAPESGKVTAQSANTIKTTEKITAVINHNSNNRQQAVALPNLQENVVSKSVIPTSKDRNTDVRLPRDNVVTMSTARKDGNSDMGLPYENVGSKFIAPSKKDGKNNVSLARDNVVFKSTISSKKDGSNGVNLPHENVSKSTTHVRKDGNTDVSLSHENVVSKNTFPMRKDGNRDVSLSHEDAVSKHTLPMRKDRNTDVSLSCENVLSKSILPIRNDGNTDVRLPIEKMSTGYVCMVKDRNADVSLPRENVVSKSSIPTRKDVRSPREKFACKDPRKGVNVTATKSHDSLNGLEEIRSSILAELEKLCQCHAPDSLVTHLSSSVVSGKTMRQRKTLEREEKGQVKTSPETQNMPVRNQTKVNTPEATNKKTTTRISVKSPEKVHTVEKKASEARVVTPPKERAADKTTTSTEAVRRKVVQKHKPGTSQDNSACVPEKRSRTIPVEKQMPKVNNPTTSSPATGTITTKLSMDGDYVYFQFGGEECIHRNPFSDRTESKAELLLRLELLSGEMKRHESLVKSSPIAEDAPLQRQRLILQLELELLQSWLLYQGVGQLLFPGHPLPAALQLGSEGKKTVTENQRVMLLDRVPTVEEYGKLYDLRQTLETSRKLHMLGIKGENITSLFSSSFIILLSRVVHNISRNLRH